MFRSVDDHRTGEPPWALAGSLWLRPRSTYHNFTERPTRAEMAHSVPAWA